MVVNHDNVCVVNEYSLVNNLDNGVLVESDSLIDMPSLENVALIVNIL